MNTIDMLSNRKCIKKFYDVRKAINIQESVDKLKYDTLGLTFRKNEGEEVCDLFKTGF